jgi:hypothetical protein
VVVQDVNKAGRNAKILNLHLGALGAAVRKIPQDRFNSPSSKVAEVASTSELSSPAQLAEVFFTSASSDQRIM